MSDDVVVDYMFIIIIILYTLVIYSSERCWDSVGLDRTVCFS